LKKIIENRWNSGSIYEKFGENFHVRFRVRQNFSDFRSEIAVFLPPAKNPKLLYLRHITTKTQLLNGKNFARMWQKRKIVSNSKIRFKDNTKGSYGYFVISQIAGKSIVANSKTCLNGTRKALCSDFALSKIA
jgi:hypothetical protein